MANQWLAEIRWQRKILLKIHSKQSMARCREAIVWLMLTIIMTIFFSSQNVVCAQRKGRGLTSEYVRSRGENIDMPLDADVFQEPPGFNTPQQVCSGMIHTHMLRSKMLLNIISRLKWPMRPKVLPDKSPYKSIYIVLYHA